MPDSLYSIIRDTTSYILRTDVVSFYKDLADAQSTQFTIIISVIGVIFAVVVGATWWWNYKGAKSQISEEILSNINILDTRFDEFKSCVNDSLNDIVEKKINEHLEKSITDFTKRTDDILKDHEANLSTFQNDVDNRINAQQAELCRVFAVHCDSTKSYYNAFTWWFSAFKFYHGLDNGEFTQISIRAALQALNNLEKKDVKKDNLSDYIQQIKDNVPDILKSERDEMINRIKVLTESDNKIE